MRPRACAQVATGPWRRLLAPILAGLAALAVGVCNAADWKRFDTEHFTLYTEREEAVATDLLRQLEHLRWLGHKYLGARESTSATRSRFAIYETPGPMALRELFSGLRDGSGPGRVYTAGVYTFCNEGAAAYTVPGSQNAELTSLGQAVLQHEYAHHLMFTQAGAGYPAWFVEGFAEYLSQTAVASDRLVIGAFNTWRNLERDWMPMESLLSWHRLSAAQREADTTSFYSQSWLLTHFILTDGERATRLPAYFERLSRDEDPVASFEASFGLKVADLPGQLRRHLRQMTELRMPLSALPAVQVRAVALPADAGQYLLDDSRLRTCVHQDKVLGPQMLQRLRSHAAQPAASAPLRLAAARAELLLGDVQAARALLEPLMQGLAEDADAQYLWGRTWALLAPKLAGDEQTLAWKQARSALLQAYRLRKGDPPTLFHLALVLMRDGSDRNVLNAARAARVFAPAVTDYALLDMRISIESGDRPAAERALRPLTLNSHQPAAAERARRAIDALRAGGSAAEVAAVLSGPPKAAAP